MNQEPVADEERAVFVPCDLLFLRVLICLFLSSLSRNSRRKSGRVKPNQSESNQIKVNQTKSNQIKPLASPRRSAAKAGNTPPLWCLRFGASLELGACLSALRTS